MTLEYIVNYISEKIWDNKTRNNLNSIMESLK